MFNKNATIIEYPAEAGSRDSSVNIMTKLQTGHPGKRDAITS
jgi:hypothetical protein